MKEVENSMKEEVCVMFLMTKMDFHLSNMFRLFYTLDWQVTK